MKLEKIAIVILTIMEYFSVFAFGMGFAVILEYGKYGFDIAYVLVMSLPVLLFITCKYVQKITKEEIATMEAMGNN